MPVRPPKERGVRLALGASVVCMLLAIGLFVFALLRTFER
jgi:hypothetical protein